MLTRYFEKTNFQEQSISRKVDSLQEYVSENGLTAYDSGMLTLWMKKNSLVLMEIYRSNILLYTSSSPEQFIEEENELESPYYDWISYYSVLFADGECQVVIYADDTQKWFSALTIISRSRDCKRIPRTEHLHQGRPEILRLCRKDTEEPVIRCIPRPAGRKRGIHTYAFHRFPPERIRDRRPSELRGLLLSRSLEEVPSPDRKGRIRIIHSTETITDSIQ